MDPDQTAQMQMHYVGFVMALLSYQMQSLTVV
jgi:hypothetical protein